MENMKAVRIHSYGGPEVLKYEDAPRQAFIFMQPNASQLAEIATLVDSGKLKPVVGTVLPLSDARRAHELSETGHTHGKIVMCVA